ncbi:MAG: hypothetical protein OQK78_01700 [Gammaproteobacteria bacterium]|nr:hypothetical protein [Gammaproteobacteria bacterium]
MKNYLKQESFLGEAEDAEDAVRSSELLEQKLALLEKEIAELDASQEDVRLGKQVECGYILLDLDRMDEAWSLGHETFKKAVSTQSWLEAVESCDIIYQAEKDDAVKALGHGIWLGVTFPVEPELSIAMLQHLIDESPDRSDGSAVAAATASYIVDLRIEDDKRREDLKFFVTQMMGEVARRHSQVDEQEVFDFWVQKLEIDDPAKFLPRLGQVVETIVDNDWWYDRDELRKLIPEV